MESQQDKDNPRVVIPNLCRKFYDQGWMSGTGGALSMRSGDKIFTTPSGVQKELVEAEDLFVQTLEGDEVCLPPAEKKLRQSTCTPLIRAVFKKHKGANATFHLHNKSAVMVSMLWPGTEFRITHQKLIQCIQKGDTGKNWDYHDTLVVPIIENKSTEDEIEDSMVAAMTDYPDTVAVIIRRHGMYVWGPTWQRAKAMAESFDYLFDVALQMKQFGLDPAQTPVPPKGAYT